MICVFSILLPSLFSIQFRDLFLIEYFLILHFLFFTIIIPFQNFILFLFLNLKLNYILVYIWSISVYIKFINLYALIT